MRRFLPILILLLGTTGLVALVMSKPQRDPLEAEEKAWFVDVAAVRPQTLVPQLTLYGRTDSPRIARLSAGVTADVREVRFLEGEYVGAEEVLVVLDAREAELLLEQREAEVADIRAQIEHERQRFDNDRQALEHEEVLLALTRREVQRARELARTQAGSQSQIDQLRQAEERQALALQNRRFSVREHATRLAQLEARLARAQALARLAQIEVERTRVTAPFDGRVSDVSVSPGDRVRNGDPLLTVYDTASMEIRAQIPTRHVPSVRDDRGLGAGLRAHAVVDGRVVTAVLDRFTAQIERGSGGTDAFFRVTDGGRALGLGRTVELVVDLPPVENAVALPLEAVYGNDRIYVLENDRMRALRVERLGERRTAPGGAELLVRSPELDEGDRVIVTQLPNAMDGLRVKIARPAALDVPG